MRFALLGDDPDVLPLVRAVAKSDEHALTHAVLLGDLSGKVLAAAPRVRVVDDWSELLTAKLDAVIVGGIGELIEEAAKRTASEGTPLIVFPRIEHGDSLVYELSLIRDETSVLLFPAVPVTHIVATIILPNLWERLEERGEPPPSSPLHLRMRRKITASVAGGPWLDRRAIEAALLPDLMLLCPVGEAYQRVTAIYSGTAEKISTATVTLSGGGLPDALWTCEPADAANWELSIALAEEHRTLILRSGEHEHDVVAETDMPPHGDAPGVRVPFDPDWIERLLAGFGHDASAMPTQDRLLVTFFVDRKDGLHSAFEWPNWDDLVRAYEMLDAARRSVRRGRTIELHFEETSERSQFKTQMTAIGCGVLLLTLFAVIALLLIGAAFDQRTVVEKKADAAGAIITADEFVTDSDQLTAAGRAHVDRLAERLPRESFPVVVAMSDEPDDLDRARRARVVKRLQDAGIANAATQVELIALAGPSFAAVMRVARLLVFAPLFLYLIAQLLLFVTRPKAS